MVQLEEMLGKEEEKRGRGSREVRKKEGNVGGIG
jgi:hypothetical protein